MNTNLAEKLSTLVLSQLPEFLRGDPSDPTSDNPYKTFVAFLQAYYEFLEQNGEAQYVIQNAKSYKDIDQTIDDFVDKFLQEFAYDLPGSIFKDQQTLELFDGVDEYESKRLIAKHISQVYASKGSEAAIRLLFRLLFNDEISFYYPKEDLLRASDGKWVEKKSIKVYEPTGNINYLNYGGNLITGTTTGATAVVDTVYALGSEYTGLSVYELQLEKDSISGTFAGNELIRFSAGNTISGNAEITGNAYVLNVISNVTIIDPGYGYTAGTTYSVSGSGQSYDASVYAVNDGGKIKAFKVNNFGAKYDSVSNITIAKPTTTVSAKYALKSNIVTAVFTTQNHGLSANDTINVTFSTGLSSASNGDYTVLEVPSTKKIRFYVGNTSVVTGNLIVNSRQANLVPVIGTLCSYMGTYGTGVEGQLDTQIKLQDSYYYQEYSYVIRTTKASTYWKDIIKKILHPAGLELFGEVYVTVESSADAAFVPAPSVDVYSTIIVFLKILAESVAATYSATTTTASPVNIVLEINNAPTKGLYPYVIGPTWSILDQFKFKYTDLRIQDLGSISLDYLNVNSNEPTNFAPPNEIQQTGANVVTNSYFTGGTNWTAGTNWTINGSAIGLLTSSNAYTTTTTLANSTVYVLQYEVTVFNVGSFKFYLTANGFSNVTQSRSALGKYTDYIFVQTANSSVGNLIINPTSFGGTIANVFLKPLTSIVG